MTWEPLRLRQQHSSGLHSSDSDPGSAASPSLISGLNFSSGLDTMIVAVSIPLVDKGNELNLYRVHNLPLKVRL